jgi:hypothetical protein
MKVRRGMPRLVLLILAFAIPEVVRAQDTPRERRSAMAGEWSLPVVGLPPELDRVLRDYEAAWRAGDGAGLADVFTPDGMILSSGQLPQRGRDAVRASRTRPGSGLQLVAFAHATGDTVGYIVGGYRVFSIGPEGKFVLALRRRPGEPWLIAADIENGNGSR